ncbi:MAG: acyl-CoA desaturase [Fimbriimonas ginsengisoli]|uniref:Acyl-CoA desaturase n=1 Tax=Fimbriimonas ginsengisoli TaxID=1005039 RepID=A0A931LRZ9_FIMGI|nr:acyl-CoA desaturase [Fimbriimonas ginsengisoli]
MRPEPFLKNLISSAFRHVVVSAIIFGPLAGIVLGCWYFAHEPVGWRLAVVLSLVFTGRFYAKIFGVSLGYHRYLTHAGFTANPVVEFMMLLAASTAMQGPCMNWAMVHRQHHAHADKPGDPHSPLEGFWHAHCFWLYSWPFIRKIKPPFDRPEYKLARFMNNTFVLWVALDAFSMYAIFGWVGLVWLWLGCNAMVNQLTYAVNSVCHMYGKRNFDTPDQSRNFKWLFFLSGEIWHNNHHRNPTCAAHGLMKGEPDVAYGLIKLMNRWHWISDVQHPTERTYRGMVSGARPAYAVATPDLAALSLEPALAPGGPST